MSASSEENITKYALRITERTQREIEEAHSWLASLTDERVAEEWEDGLYEELLTLSIFPNRCVVADESRHFPKIMVRQTVYRRRPHSSAAYRILFRVQDETDDGPIVRIMHIRHAARRPITRAEAREIAGDADVGLR